MYRNPYLPEIVDYGREEPIVEGVAREMNFGQLVAIGTSRMWQEKAHRTAGIRLTARHAYRLGRHEPGIDSDEVIKTLTKTMGDLCSVYPVYISSALSDDKYNDLIIGAFDLGVKDAPYNQARGVA